MLPLQMEATCPEAISSADAKALAAPAPEASTVIGPWSSKLLSTTEAYWLVSSGLGPVKDLLPRKGRVWGMTAWVRRCLRRPALYLRCEALGVLTVAQQVKIPTSICEDVGSIPGLAEWVKGPTLP